MNSKNKVVHYTGILNKANFNIIIYIHYRHNKLRIALFTQHHIDQLDLELSPVEQIAKLAPNMATELIRSHLGSFGITGTLGLRPNYLLSGGQKTRVALAALVFKNPHILLIDDVNLIAYHFNKMLIMRNYN